MAIDEDWMSPRSETQLSNDNPKVISPQALRMAISHMSKSDAGRAQLCRPDGTSLETSLITLARGHSMSETEFEREARKLLKPQVAKSLAKLAADISVSQRTLGGKGILKLMDAGGNLSGTQSFQHFSPGGVGRGNLGKTGHMVFWRGSSLGPGHLANLAHLVRVMVGAWVLVTLASLALLVQVVVEAWVLVTLASLVIWCRGGG